MIKIPLRNEIQVSSPMTKVMIDLCFFIFVTSDESNNDGSMGGQYFAITRDPGHGGASVFHLIWSHSAITYMYMYSIHFSCNPIVLKVSVYDR